MGYMHQIGIQRLLSALYLTAKLGLDDIALFDGYIEYYLLGLLF